MEVPLPDSSDGAKSVEFNKLLKNINNCLKRMTKANYKLI